jgi:hypothetical protein
MKKREPERITIEEYRHLASLGTPAKYRNVAVYVDGYRFDSKLEARRYAQLKQLQAAGEVKWFICQVPFRLPGGIVYRADFLVVWRRYPGVGLDEYIGIEDCKGFMTSVADLKIKQVEAIYGIKVNLIRA